MIGLRRAAPDRQGDPIAHAPPTAKSAGRFNVKYKNCCIRLFWRRISAKCIIELFAQRDGRALSAISAIRRYFDERCAADSLRKRDKNSAIILRHDHNPAK